MVDATTAMTTDHSGTVAGMGVRLSTAKAIRAPRPMPIMPPSRVRVAASTRNWNMISPRVAPRAFRTPISRVRSVTEIIMIAITPTPPTRSPTLESASMTRKKPLVRLLKVSSSRSWVMTAKLLSSDGRRPRLDRSAAITSSWAWATVTPSWGMTESSIQPREWVPTLEKVLCGMMTRGPSSSPKSPAASAYTPITVNGWSKILIRRCSGSSPGNSWSASLSLITTTAALAACSIWLKFRPSTSVPPLVRIQAGLYPLIRTALRFTSR